MPEATSEKTPFKALSFSFNDRAHGRMTVRMKYLQPEEREASADSYRLHIEQGPAERTTTCITKGAGTSQASKLCEALLEAGAFSWEDSYPDNPVNGSSRWMLNIVFEPDVFELHSRGGSDYPAGFDAMMEAFYGLGLPRPEEAQSSAYGFAGPDAGMPAPGMFNPANLQGLFGQMQQSMGLPAGFDMEAMQMAMEDMAADPARFQERMRSEFRSMPQEQRNALLDMLASTGMGSRDWWERFLLG